jgi:ABC-2 type transport system permease protein
VNAVLPRPLRVELRKLRTIRLPWAAAAAVVGLSALVTFAGISLAGEEGNDPLSAASLLDGLRAPVSIVTIVAMLLGVVASAGEHRHGTIVSTVLAAGRSSVVTAKVAAAAVAGAVLAALSMTTVACVAVPMLSAESVGLPPAGEAALVAAGAILASASYGGLGAAVGAIVRSQTAAIGAVLVWVLAAEGVLGDVLRRPELERWLPGGAVRALVRWDGDAVLAPATGALVLVAVLTVVSLAAVAVVRRRDVV